VSGRPLSEIPREIYRIAWLPGTAVLHGTCHCGREHNSQDPIEMWEWMLAHPQGHELRPDQAQGSGS
jgi:hypothetical protein